MRLPLALLALLAAAPARAQAPDAKAQARQHFDRGMTHYNLAEWDAAIAEFERAYVLSREPELLFNIGQAKRLKGDARGALDSYRSYLRLAPQAANRAEVDKQIAELEREELRRKPKTTAPRPASAPATAPATRPAPGNQVMRVDAKVMRVEVKGRQESSVLTWTGLIVAGAGLVGVGAGTYYGVRARQNWSQVEGIHQDSLDWGDREQEYWDDAEAQERRAKVLLGVGAATVIVGGVLYVLGARSGGDTSMSASASPGGAVVGVSGAF